MIVGVDVWVEVEVGEEFGVWVTLGLFVFVDVIVGVSEIVGDCVFVCVTDGVGSQHGQSVVVEVVDVEVVVVVVVQQLPYWRQLVVVVGMISVTSGFRSQAKLQLMKYTGANNWSEINISQYSSHSQFSKVIYLLTPKPIWTVWFRDSEPWKLRFLNI